LEQTYSSNKESNAILSSDALIPFDGDVHELIKLLLNYESSTKKCNQPTPVTTGATTGPETTTSTTTLETKGVDSNCIDCNETELEKLEDSATDALRFILLMK